MQEFPKALYPNGDATANVRIVLDDDGEAQARLEGFDDVHEQPEELDAEALMAEAEGLGIKVDKRWSVKRLSEEVAKAKA
ncbi:hypothetical protein [Cupriavidus campinensis]